MLMNRLLQNKLEKLYPWNDIRVDILSINGIHVYAHT